MLTTDDLGQTDRGAMVELGHAVVDDPALFLLFLGYLALRSAGRPGAGPVQRDRVMALVLVPFIHLTVTCSAPCIRSQSCSSRALFPRCRPVLTALLMGFGATTLLYLQFVSLRRDRAGVKPTEDAANDMPDTGGFMIAGYAVATIICGYAVSLLIRARKAERARVAEEGRQGRLVGDTPEASSRL
jgi:hypothetical protein